MRGISTRDSELVFCPPRHFRNKALNTFRMGTRHLILVFYKGAYRIAQYGQWDGYPSSERLNGTTALPTCYSD